MRSRVSKRFGDDELRFLQSLSSLLATSLQRAQFEEALNHAQRMEGVGQLTGGMSAALVRQMDVAAGVPVFDGVASQTHPTARLADLLAGDASKLDKRCFVLQAVLLSMIA